MPAKEGSARVGQEALIYLWGAGSGRQPSRMQKELVLITDTAHPLLAEGLGDLGYEVVVRPDILPEEVRRMAGSCRGLVINSKIVVDASMLASAPELAFVARLGSGLEIIDLEEARRRGVRVFSAPEGNCNAVAEHALGMLLCLANHLTASDREVRDFQWHREKNRGWELAGRTVGIVGVGHTGSALARKLRGMSVRVLGHDKYKPDWKDSLPWVERVEASDISREADIISLHLPLTPETRHYVDNRYIASCREGFVLINTARGNQVDTRALVEALVSGKAGGACLDVFENEKPETMSSAEKDLYRRLYHLPNVMLSPHVAGWTRESLERIAAVLLEKIRMWRLGNTA